MADVPADPMQLLILAAIEALPDVVDIVKELVHRKDPDLPPPTNEVVFAALEQAFQSSLAKDEQWLAAHPEGSTD